MTKRFLHISIDESYIKSLIDTYLPLHKHASYTLLILTFPGKEQAVSLASIILKIQAKIALRTECTY